MNKRQKVIISILLLMIITTLVDIYTAIKNPVFLIGETNPIFVLTGSLSLLTIINFAIVIWFVYVIKESISFKGISYFVIISLFISLGHIIGAASNLFTEHAYNINQEKIVKELTEMSIADKLTYYGFVAGLIIVPMFISIFAFSLIEILYESQEVKRIERLSNIEKYLKKEIKILTEK